jgi:hypothetical protein
MKGFCGFFTNKQLSIVVCLGNLKQLLLDFLSLAIKARFFFQCGIYLSAQEQMSMSSLLQTYSVFHQFWQAKFACCGLILSLSQFLLLLKKWSKLTQK